MKDKGHLMTADDLFRLPDDGFIYELVKGELKQYPLNGVLHGMTVVNFLYPLFQHVEKHELGIVFGPNVGFLLTTAPDTVRAPDVTFIKEKKIPLTGIPEGYWSGAPDLAVEVLSPDDTIYNIDEKLEDYISAGSLMVVVTNPRRRTLSVHRPNMQLVLLTEDDFFDGGEVIPGFRLEIRRLFARRQG